MSDLKISDLENFAGNNPDALIPIVTDGSTHHVSWRILASLLYNKDSGQIVIDTTSRVLNGAGETPSVDWLNRFLANNSGVMELQFSDGILMPNLPTSDPNVANQLWNNAGVLSVSAG